MNEMSVTCACGMTLEQPSRRTGCEECGTAVCRSCAVQLETIAYCRWCAPSAALGHAF